MYIIQRIGHLQLFRVCFIYVTIAYIQIEFSSVCLLVDILATGNTLV